tara:strand:- start:87 stop:632 length:546 start_codon:yes stop_codon:yes gene_type:complete
MNKGFFFDRDGILNELVRDDGSLRPPNNTKELVLNYEIFDSINKLKRFFKIFIVTNQPDVARGSLSKNNLMEINKIINKKLVFDDIEIEIEDDTNKKKPNPFMLNRLIKKYNIDSKNSWIFGDRWVDIQAGKSAGLKTILLEKEYSYDPSSSKVMEENLIPDFKIDNLSDFNQLVSSYFLQ